MEKMLRFAAALLALILLSGCAADNKPVQSEPQTSASSESVSAVSWGAEPEVTVQETSSPAAGARAWRILGQKGSTSSTASSGQSMVVTSAN